MSSHTGEIILGLLGTAFFTLIWRRLDAIDKRMGTIETDMKHFYSITGKLDGRVDEISSRVK